MQSKEKNTKPLNPFSDAKDEKVVWEYLLKNSKPVDKQVFLNSVRNKK